MKHFSLIILLFILTCLFLPSRYIRCSAQSTTDTLSKELRAASSDTAKSRILRKLAYKYMNGDLKKALGHAEKALELALKSNDLKHIERSYFCLGHAHMKISHYDKAREYLLKALQNAKTLNDKKAISEDLGSIGDIFLKTGDYKEAIKYYHKALKIDEESNDLINATVNLNAISGVYFYEKNYEKSLEYLEKALKISEKLNDPLRVAQQLHNLATNYRIKRDYPEAEKYFLKSLTIAQKINSKRLIASNKANLGLIYFNHKRNYTEALRYFQESLALRQEIGDLSGISKNYGQMASVYLVQGDISKALGHYDKSVEIAQKAQSPEDLKHAYMYLSEAYSRAKRFDKALEYYKKFVDVKDSLVNKDIAAKTEELSLRYETEKKDNSIKLLTKENSIRKLQIRERNLLIYGLAALFPSVTLVFLLLYHRRKLIADRKAAELEQKLLRMRMNPHFIFNALNAVRAFMDDNKTEEAAEYLADFAALMRSTLESSFNDYVPLEDELESLRQYLRLQKVRFGDKLHFLVEVDPSLETEEIAVPPMLAQPFIENAVEHGVRGSEEKVTVTVRFGPGKEKNTLLFETEDDRLHGETLSTELPVRKKHVSRAVKITEERLKGFNKKKKRKIALDILRPADPQANRGTKVIFKIPFVYS